MIKQYIKNFILNLQLLIIFLDYIYPLFKIVNSLINLVLFYEYEKLLKINYLTNYKPML